MEGNSAEMANTAENQPSTSAASDPDIHQESIEDKTDDEMARLLQATDEILENKAKSMNLSSLNVRSILHHLIKYPSTIDVLLGIRETDDLPSVRNMRSRKKPDDAGPSSALNSPKKIAIRIEDRGPKNFLDLEYDEDDEYDDDYVDEGGHSKKEADMEGSEEEEENYEDEEDEEDEEEPEEVADEVTEMNMEYESGEPGTSASAQNHEYSDILFEENMDDPDEPYSMNLTLNDTRPGSAAMVHTLDNVVDDDDYRNFVFSIQHPPDDYVSDDGLQTVYDTEDDAEDEDYNVITDNLNVEDWDETRQDKTTMIPRHEVKALMMDTLLAEKDIPINVFPQDMHKEEQRKTQKDRDAEVCERVNESVTSSIESCTLLKPGLVTFRREEIEQLQLQLQQHVQLLTQFVVTCHHDPALCYIQDSAQLMMNQLDDIRQQKNHQTIFDIANLDSAIETCHDINLFPPVDPNLVNYAKNPDASTGFVLRPEAAAVLARSRAITFPSLLPLCQPRYHENRLTHFLHEEDIMLALALIQFAHLPRRAEKKNPIDRYTVIERNCLPARSALQIRNHLKTMRRQSKKNPIHSIIQAAEQGICNLTIPQNSWKRTNGAICTWPKVSQPGWYREFQKTFNVTEDRRIHRKNEATMILTPVKKSYAEYEKEISDGNMGPPGEAEIDFVNIGNGPDGRKIIVERNQIDVLMRQLIVESKLSPSKRRKNSTPMKLSQMKQLEEASEIHTADNQNSIVSSNIEPPAGSPTDTQQLICYEQPSISRVRQHAMDAEPSTSAAHPSSSENDKPLGKSPPRTLLDISDYQMSAENLNRYDWDYNSCSSFPIPLTPGRRTPEQYENDDYLDLESNSMMWPRSGYSVGNPMTPRGYAFDNDELDPIDFSSITANSFLDEDDFIQYNSYDCQQPMGFSSRMEECSSSASIPEEQPNEYIDNRYNCESVADEESSMPGLDMVPLDYEEEEQKAVEETEQVEEVVVEEPTVVRGRNIRQTNARPPLRYLKDIEAGITIPNLKPSRKRTRAEREAMGVVGLDDMSLREKQKEKVNLKVVGDIRQKLFMHKDTYKKFKRTITNDELSDIEKISRVILVLANHPELLNLVLLFAPPEAIISDFDCHSNFQSYKAAMEMIMDIERYITAAKLKEPSLRSLWRFIRNFLQENPDLQDEQATRQFHQLFGQDRPLWKKLESHFWCLPFKGKPNLENFEYIDLTGVEAMTKREIRDWYNIPPRFETVDNIDQVVTTSYRPSKQDPPSDFVVKCGEMCIKKDEETFIQLEINERLWTRNDDITLLTAYSEAQKTSNFKYSMIPSYVPSLPFGEKSIVARLKYLLAELKALEE